MKSFVLNGEFHLIFLYTRNESEARTECTEIAMLAVFLLPCCIAAGCSPTNMHIISSILKLTKFLK